MEAALDGGATGAYNQSERPAGKREKCPEPGRRFLRPRFARKLPEQSERMNLRMMLVSACLAGIRCRYDGGCCQNEAAKKLVAAGRALPVCPEQLGGLPTPRCACEIDAACGRVRTRDGRDLTDAFARGAEKTLAIAKEARAARAALKSKSPSCGCGLVCDGSFTGRLVPGNGVTAALLKANGVEIFTEADLARLLAEDGGA
jgi:uncharacterized protein YbbK (DUF523 family)